VSNGPRETTIAGRLTGEPRGEAGCAWLETATGQRVEVSYPNGWRIEFDPVAIYDETDRSRGAEGDILTVVGYFAEVGDSVCRPEAMFIATDVVST
jgi:hypothetical protein